jgi:type VI protein secretion system component VasF
MSRRHRPRGRKRALTPATLIMWIIVASFLVFFFGSRYTLDYTGPYLAELVQRIFG